MIEMVLLGGVAENDDVVHVGGDVAGHVTEQGVHQSLERCRGGAPTSPKGMTLN